MTANGHAPTLIDRKDACDDLAEALEVLLRVPLAIDRNVVNKPNELVDRSSDRVQDGSRVSFLRGICQRADRIPRHVKLTVVPRYAF